MNSNSTPLLGALLFATYLLGLCMVGAAQIAAAKQLNGSSYHKAWIAAYVVLVLEFIHVVTSLDSIEHYQTSRTLIAIQAIQIPVILIGCHFLRRSLTKPG